MKKLLTVFTALFFTTSAHAVDVYKFDPNHTSVSWSANHFGFSNPSGKFTEVEGTISLDEANPQNSSVDVVIRIASLNTGLPKFDTHLKSADFFNLDKYPLATFVSTAVTPLGKNSAKVAGDLTICGVKKQVTLDVKLNKNGIGPVTQKKTVGFSASANIKRSQFDMIFGLPGVSDNVKLSIEAEGNLVSSDDKTSSAGEWRIIPSKSSITFKADQNGSSISGSFKKFDGKINFDPAQLQSSKAAIEIDTTSIDISFADALETLQGAAWFATKTFPKATFTSEKFTALGGKKSFRSNGILTIKGKAVPIILEFVLAEYSATAAHITGQAFLKRSAFGIGDRDPKKANGVKDDITVTVDVVAEK